MMSMSTKTSLAETMTQTPGHRAAQWRHVQIPIHLCVPNAPSGPDEPLPSAPDHHEAPDRPRSGAPGSISPSRPGAAPPSVGPDRSIQDDARVMVVSGAKRRHPHQSHWRPHPWPGTQTGRPLRHLILRTTVQQVPLERAERRWPLASPYFVAYAACRGSSANKNDSSTNRRPAVTSSTSCKWEQLNSNAAPAGGR